MADIPIAVDVGSVSITGAAPTFGKIAMLANISLPMLVASGAMQDIRLPMFTVSAEALPGTAADTGVGLQLPSMTAAAVALRGSTYTGDATLPAITLEASFGTSADVVLPKLTSAGTILAGQSASAAVSLPRLTASGSALGDGVLTGEATLPALMIAVHVDSGRVMEAAITLKKLALAAAGYSGTVGTAAVSLPIFTTDGSGHGEYIGQASIELPMLQLVATLPLQTGLTETVTVFAMNAKTGALTNYDNFNFNSMASFNGVELMANSSGIFAITGNLDESAIIDAYARMGVTDFGTANHKRVESAYIGYRSDGEMRLKLIVDEHHEYEYQVYPRNYDDVHGNRLKLGRGAKGTYWQTEVGNVGGSDFDIDFLQLMAEPLPRKV